MDNFNNNMNANNFNGTNNVFAPNEFPSQPMNQDIQRKSTKKVYIILAIVIPLIIIITSVIIITYTNSVNYKLIGHWIYTEKSTKIEMIINRGGDGTMIVTYKKDNEEKTESLEMTWEYNKDTQYLTISVKENLKGEPASASYKIVEITDNTMTVMLNNQICTYTKIN